MGMGEALSLYWATMDPEVVVGFDLGRANLGWAKVRLRPTPKLLGHGVIALPNLPMVEAYMPLVRNGLSDLLEGAQAVATEQITYFTRRQEHAKGTGASKTWVQICAIGMSIQALAHEMGLSFKPISPQGAKQKATGSRSGSKLQLYSSVLQIFPDFGRPHKDYHDSDAAAIAVAVWAPELFISSSAHAQ